MRAKRCQTKGDQQYTIRVAPMFLGPYTRRSVSELLEGLGSYLTGALGSLEEVAIRLRYESIKSVVRYLNRALLRLGEWSTETLLQISKMGGYTEPSRELRQENIKPKGGNLWRRFSCLVTVLIVRLEEIGGKVGEYATRENAQALVLCAQNPWRGLGPDPPPKDGRGKKAPRGKS